MNNLDNLFSLGRGLAASGELFPFVSSVTLKFFRALDNSSSLDTFVTFLRTQTDFVGKAEVLLNWGASEKK